MRNPLGQYYVCGLCPHLPVYLAATTNMHMNQDTSTHNTAITSSIHIDPCLYIVISPPSLPPHSPLTIRRFDPQRVVQQLRACGILETVQISAAGFPSRWLYEEFFERYRCLLPSGQVRRDDCQLMSHYILDATIQVYRRLVCKQRKVKSSDGLCFFAILPMQDKNKYQYGKTKIFFRAGQVINP